MTTETQTCDSWKQIGKGYGHRMGKPCERSAGHRGLHRAMWQGKSLRWLRRYPGR